jgi:hypothetical protein
MIDCKEELANARDSIRCNCDSGSNQIDKKDLHSEKEPEPITLTPRGIVIKIIRD